MALSLTQWKSPLPTTPRSAPHQSAATVDYPVVGACLTVRASDTTIRSLSRLERSALPGSFLFRRMILVQPLDDVVGLVEFLPHTERHERGGLQFELGDGRFSVVTHVRGIWVD